MITIIIVMGRPLKPFNNKRMAEYETHLKNALAGNDKKELKRVKRLVLVYLKKRGMSIADIKDKGIYSFFADREKESKIDYYKRQEKECRFPRGTTKRYKEHYLYAMFGKTIDYLEHKKYNMREYRKRKYIKTRFNTMTTKLFCHKMSYPIFCEYAGVKIDYSGVISWLITNHYKYGASFCDICKRVKNKIEKKIKELENEYYTSILKKHKKEKIEFVSRRLNEDLENDYTDLVNSFYTDRLKNYDLTENDIKYFEEVMKEYEQEYIDTIVFKEKEARARAT